MAKQTFTTGQVLNASALTSLQQTAMGGGSTTAKTASYTLVAADAGTVVQMNSSSATTITVNQSLFAQGDSVQIQNVGSGVCTVTAGTATVSTAGSLALSQYEGGQLYFNTTSAALFFDVVQASGSTFVGARIRPNVDQVISNATFTALAYQTETYDTSAFHDNSTNNSRITIPAGKAGYYLLTAGNVFPATGCSMQLYFYLNGSGYSRAIFFGTTGGIITNNHTDVISLAVGDYVQAFIYQTSGGNLSTSTGYDGNFFEATYLGA